MKNIRCAECNSTLTYFKIGTSEMVCRRCGNVWIEVSELEKRNTQELNKKLAMHKKFCEVIEQILKTRQIS